MQDYEKLGVFYLGRRWDAKTRKTLPDLLLYDSKDLTTHGVCVGMTGSGKTGLLIAGVLYILLPVPATMLARKAHLLVPRASSIVPGAEPRP